ncbi:uncharacterized protein UTRI_01693 [Ustilago trichophora]|uniref:Uncharacterized protein n=1 Tax=Ustilago trichophora TaxID=86804 RepID=A0A5C3DXM0_9BASI|nr:uncharacterized protein UTRI_01693 [Ustilago trichophora]
MSAQKRRPQQPQHPYQSNYTQQHQQQQQFPQDPGYSQQYAGVAAPWQAIPSHPHQQPPQLYYQPHQYPSTDPYAFATSNTQFSASASPYPQHVQYQSSSYYPQSQPFALPNAAGYHNAYPQGGYLAAAAATDDPVSSDLSPNHLSPGSLSSGHSPKPSAGRSRLSNFVFPSQATSPSLESHVAHLSLTAPLPNKPTSAAAFSPNPGSASASRPASGMAHSSQLKPLSSNTPVALDEARSHISLRYPPLPEIPARPATPPLIQLHIGRNPTADESTPAPDQSVLDYVSSLLSIIHTYEQRDDLLRLRTEAVGFQPKQAYLAWQASQATIPTSPTSSSDTDANPVLGIRLLQRLDALQRENDELGRLLSSATLSTTNTDTQVQELQKEIIDSHTLIQAMDNALSNAEARAKASERALQVACRTNSTSILADQAEHVKKIAGGTVKSGVGQGSGRRGSKGVVVGKDVSGKGGMVRGGKAGQGGKGDAKYEVKGDSLDGGVKKIKSQAFTTTKDVAKK